MVLGVDGKPFVRGVMGKAARHGEAQEHAVHLQPQVVVQAPGFVAVDDEAQPAVRAARGRLGRPGEVSLGPVAVERLRAGGVGGSPRLPARVDHRAAALAAARAGGSG